MPSSVILKYQYYKTEQILEITFVSGSVYHYKNVPENVYQKFRQARSRGLFLNEHIKPGFVYEKISEE